jgi:dihydrofolate reductase
MISIIAAMSENHVIGRDGDLPWHLPADLAHFKRLTSGHHVIMGRRTFDSVGKPLPNRTCIIVTRKTDLKIDGAIVTNSLNNALAHTPNDEDVFILGGGEIYRLALSLADRMYLTIVHATLDGDTFFPEFDESNWSLVEDERHDADERHAYAFSFRRYDRAR